MTPPCPYRTPDSVCVDDAGQLGRHTLAMVDQPEHCRGYGESATALWQRGDWFPCSAPEDTEACTCTCGKCKEVADVAEREAHRG